MAKNMNMKDANTTSGRTQNAKNTTTGNNNAKTQNKAQNKTSNAKNTKETSSYESDCNY